MALETNETDKINAVLTDNPRVNIFLQPIAAPAALGLAGFAGSTFITASWVARWWGGPDSPLVFFPFVGLWGGLAQFIAGMYGFRARDVLVTVVHGMWGAFWMSIGVLYAFVAAGTMPAHGIHEHFPELASWFIVVTCFTWSAAIAATARDIILSVMLFSLAIGSTIALCLFDYNPGVSAGIKAAAYFWIIAACLAWWRTTVYLMEEAYGKGKVVKYFPVFRVPTEKGAPLLVPGLGEPGVKRGMPGVI
ncbi:hypothetical protein CC78DRAFT_536988 [Lojkania enalia]|uniref:Uncharacterized protein n=1 Tax=Lojkania enalia TaxID=147567 RepID=A0A9P4MVX3_9PLEO|nr:hypothetical protein CC78DRAFT_536988 [Didymosphaeria enalia]